MAGEETVEVTAGRGGWPVSVILPGSASSADFVTRAFGPALTGRGIALATADPPAVGDVVGPMTAMLEEAMRRLHPVVIGGVSLGAHVAASLAASVATWGPASGADAGTTSGPAALLLALPAWTGPAEAVASLSGHAADDVAARGRDAVLASMEEAVPWVRSELARAWLRYDEESLVAMLRSTASSSAPTDAALARIDVPVGMVAFSGDPYHPLSVAYRWRAAIPRAALAVTTVAHPGRGVRVIGDLAWSALVAARAGG